MKNNKCLASSITAVTGEGVCFWNLVPTNFISWILPYDLISSCFKVDHQGFYLACMLW